MSAKSPSNRTPWPLVESSELSASSTLLPVNAALSQSQWREHVQNRLFWGEFPPCDHFVQLYHEEEPFLSSLEGFARGGLESAESVIVIATQAHLDDLAGRLENHRINVALAMKHRYYFPIVADEAMSQFMVDDWPDEKLFHALIGSLLHKARGRGQKVRAFGEMVALMWGRGLHGATIQLERLWHTLCEREGFPLYCAYPAAAFNEDMDESLHEIHRAHHRILN